MPLPDQTPQLPKWPFLLGDAGLLAAAWAIAAGAAHPLETESILAIFACVVCAGVAGAIPFLADYARRQEDALDNRQRALEALARTVSAAAEQISIAAGGLNEIAELAQRNLRQAEQLPSKTMEKIAQFDAQIAGSRSEEKKAQEKELAALRASEIKRLESTAEKIARASADWSRLAAPAERQFSAAPPAPAKPEAAPAAVPAEKVPEPAPSAIPEEKESVLGTSRSTSQEAATEPAPASIEAALAPDKPAPRKRSPKKTPAKIPLTEDGDLSAKLDLGEIAQPASEYSQAAPDDAAPAPAVSADGATRLLITAYIGIGNRLFIRGDGPGLSWEKGVPLQFVSIGKWRWDTAEATEPVKFKLYKNDEIECSALGSQILEPGHQQEVTATF